jgi:2-oxoglutarate dehydrogenase E1 component
MYERIRQRPSLHQIYAETLMEEQIVQKNEIEALTGRVNAQLKNAYETVHGSECPFPTVNFYENWEKFDGDYSDRPVNTGVKGNTLLHLAKKLAALPAGFAINKKLMGLLQRRTQAVKQGYGIDWAGAEALAFASLLTEGYFIRLSGQDSGRGTFSQRHSVLVDTENGKRFVPLNNLDENQAPFYVYDSLLSESGVLGFEYGYSLAQSDGLVMWEAQFGDFANNAQSIIDLFIISGESKWQRLSGLVLLLPHGYEGLGPEHSSARLERFLQLCANDNIQVCYPTTPAQYFHLLRRQAVSTFRKPLVVMTPKSLLRNPAAVSTLKDLSNGSFETIIDDSEEFKDARKVLFCSGKIYYELYARRKELGIADIAVVRLEQLYPFSGKRLKTLVNQYSKTKHWCWVQEEPQNMGGWQFVKPRFEKLIKRKLRYIGRNAAASPATGFPAIYRHEQGSIVEKAVGPAPGHGEQPEFG